MKVESMDPGSKNIWTREQEKLIGKVINSHANIAYMQQNNDFDVWD